MDKKSLASGAEESQDVQVNESNPLKILDDIIWEKDNSEFLETLDTFGIKQIGALTEAIVFFNDQDRIICSFLIDVLQEKVFEVDQCVQRLLHEMQESDD